MNSHASQRARVALDFNWRGISLASQFAVRVRAHGIYRQEFTHRRATIDLAQTLRQGPDQVMIEQAPRACRAACLELGDGAEPGACDRTVRLWMYRGL